MDSVEQVMKGLTKAALVEMPIGGGSGFDNERFYMGAEYEEQAQRNHGQSLARLAARGGLDWGEAAAIIEGRGWSSIQLHRYAEYEQTVRARLLSSGGEGK